MTAQGKTHRHITSRALRESMAKRLFTESRGHVYYPVEWTQVKKIIISCYADAQHIADAGAYLGKEF